MLPTERGNPLEVVKMTDFNIGDKVVFCKDTPMESYGIVARTIPKGETAIFGFTGQIHEVVEVGPSLIVHFTHGQMINSTERFRPFIERYFDLQGDN